MKTSIKEVQAKRIVVRLRPKELQEILEDLRYADGSDDGLYSIGAASRKFIKLTSARLDS